MLKPLGEDTKRQGLGAGDGFFARFAVGHYAGKFWNVRDPAAVRLLLDFDLEHASPNGACSTPNPGAVERKHC